MNEFKDCFVVDPMLLEVCKLSRRACSRTCEKFGNEISNRDIVLLKIVILWHKLLVVCFVSSVFQRFNLSPAAIHDIYYLKDVKVQIADCVLLVT